MIDDILDIITRSILSVIVLFILARLMGKKQISQLSFFDYVVGISIGSIAAALSVDDRIAYSHGIIAMIVWAVSTIAVSYLNLKSIRARRIVEGIPSVLVQNGKINQDNFVKEKYHINDLLEELRTNGVFNIADVEFAVLETGGKVSVQLKSQKQPVTCADLKIPTRYEGLSTNLIIDGQIMYDNLRLVNLDERWLADEIRNKGANSVKQVLLASLGTDGSLYVSLKGKRGLEKHTVLE